LGEIRKGVYPRIYCSKSELLEMCRFKGEPKNDYLCAYKKKVL